MRALPLLGLLLLLPACRGHAPAPESPGSRGRGSATVLTREELARAGGGDLLSTLSGAVSLMRIERRSTTSPCPVITMRGDRTVMGSRNPLVFVDGTEMTDTCVLLQIRTDDVASVEIYPGGLTSRPGYRANANGLILVFLVNGQEGG